MNMMCRPKWPFLHMYGSHDIRHVGFRGLTGSQRTPRIWGVTSTLSKQYCLFYFLFAIMLNLMHIDIVGHEPIVSMLAMQS